ncbi:endonuclease domain-containing 1 protein-like [Denticeps clupeoides]|uniref:endonuclease domain-containing 1 protein-like n=1 Tax=Denticeps clupeoides TaxID=299321 RepID=UPI0010A4DDBE|nr:endonuclease domain-containing 1 protein-like [Denticeps clupeoides]
MVYLCSAVLTILLAVGLGDVGNFSSCLEFFYHSWPTKGIIGTPICQRYENRFRFATLYSRQRRSPWFSAYVFYTDLKENRRKTPWMYEPQLANGSADGNMIPFPNGTLEQNVVESQAVQQDYKNSGFSRGHLNPSFGHRSYLDSMATFTLTNVVPQWAESNNGPWAIQEGKVLKFLNRSCIGDAYIVTGILPYESDDWWLKQDRVAVPEYLWSAYCCPTYSSKNLTNRLPTFAAIGRNDPNSNDKIVPAARNAGYDVRHMPLVELEMHLKQRFGTEVTVFHNQCSGK